MIAGCKRKRTFREAEEAAAEAAMTDYRFLQGLMTRLATPGASWMPGLAECGGPPASALERAFAELCGAGVLACHPGPSCVMPCDARYASEKQAARMWPPPRGVVCYPLLAVIPSASRLVLVYRAGEGESAPAIGREVVSALNRHGLATCWDGGPTIEVVVTPEMRLFFETL